MSKLEELKMANVEPGGTLGSYLKENHPFGVWRDKGDVFIFACKVPGYRTERLYRWGIDEQGFYTDNNGHAQELTPQFDRALGRKNDAEIRLIPFEKAVHDRLNRLIEEYEGEILDDEIMDEMAREVAEYFEISFDKVVTIYQRVQAFLLKEISGK